MESELEMVRRHVREGERLLTHQRAIVARLQDGGHSTEVAEQLLANIEDSQRMHRNHLARLLEAGGPRIT